MAELTTEKTWMLLYHLHIFHVKNFLDNMRTIIKNGDVRIIFIIKTHCRQYVMRQIEIERFKTSSHNGLFFNFQFKVLFGVDTYYTYYTIVYQFRITNNKRGYSGSI